MATAPKKTKTKAEVDEMSTEDRLYDSLEQVYGKKKEATAESYDQAISQQNNALLNRGMQRSSYGMQTVANLRDKKVQAQGDIDSGMIADYENRLNTLQQQEKANDLAERQFAEQQRQFNASQELTKSENALNRAFQTSEREAQQKYQSGENALNRAFTTSEREAQQKYQSGENALNRAFTTSEREAQQKYQSGENALNRAFTTSEREAQQKYQSGENALNREFQTAERIAQQDYNSTENRLAREFQAEQSALSREQNQSQFDAQMQYQKDRDAINDAFTREQWEAQQAQWREQFEYTKMSDTQKIAYNYILQAINAGGEPSDELLAQAGISRDDFNAMKIKAASITGSPKPNPNPGENGENGEITDKSVEIEAGGNTVDPWLEGLKRVDRFAGNIKENEKDIKNRRTGG